MDCDSMILSGAEATTSPIVKWRFVPSGHLCVNDKDSESYVGEIYYNNPNYELGGAIKIKDWVFCLERMTPKARMILAPQNNPDAWVISAFHHNEHCSFIGFVSSDHVRKNSILLEFVILNFWPMLHPEFFNNIIPNKDVEMKWTTVAFKSNEEKKGFIEGGISI